MKMDKNSNNETSRHEDDFDLDQLIGELTDSQDVDEDTDSIDSLPLRDLLDDENEESDEDEHVTVLDEDSSSDYATLARAFVDLDLSDIQDGKEEEIDTDDVIDLDDAGDIDNEEMHIDLDLSDITANTAEFQALQYSGEEDDNEMLHISLSDDTTEMQDEPLSFDQDEELQADVPVDDVSLKNDEIALEGSLEEIELEDIPSASSDMDYGSPATAMTTHESDDGIIDLDLDFGDDDELTSPTPVPEVAVKEEEKESDFLGLSSISVFSSNTGSDTEVLFGGIEMDFNDQIRYVTNAEVLLAMGRRDEATAIFREVSSKKGETNWVTKRLRLLAETHA